MATNCHQLYPHPPTFEDQPKMMGCTTRMATQVVDLYHAREHLHSLTRSLEFMLLDRKDE
jgi:hypothetical protein